jgi:nucleoid DNA-binding protein
MAKYTINFNNDLGPICKYIQARVDSQSSVGIPIAAVEIGLKLCQQGLLAINFDVREHHERDGEWTRALNGPTLALPNWSKAYMQAGRFGISFVLLDGNSISLPPCEDATVAGVFGVTLFSVVRDAVANGDFRSLPLRDDCQVDLVEFDEMWGWPADHANLGRTNLIRDFPKIQGPIYPTEQEVNSMPSRPDPQNIISAIATKAGLTVPQARAFLQAQADLAGELVAEGFPIPGIGLLTQIDRPARKMTMAFGPRKGETVEVPATQKLKFTIAPAVKEVAFGMKPAMPDVFSLEWYSPYTPDEE